MLSTGSETAAVDSWRVFALRNEAWKVSAALRHTPHHEEDPYLRWLSWRTVKSRLGVTDA